MTNKEYRKRKEQIEKFTSWDFLNPEEVKELRKDVKSRTGEFQLEGFGNRASVKEDGNRITLTSYYTEVCEIASGEFKKTWDGFSATTLKHINIFCRYYGFPTFSKREWIELETATK